MPQNYDLHKVASDSLTNNGPNLHFLMFLLLWRSLYRGSLHEDLLEDLTVWRLVLSRHQRVPIRLKDLPSPRVRRFLQRMAQLGCYRLRPLLFDRWLIESLVCSLLKGYRLTAANQF